MKHLVLTAAAALIAFAATPASAADSANLTVEATVKKVCSVQAATLAFPDYDPVTAAAVDGTATVVVKCTKETPWKLILDGATGTMTGTGAGLNYSLYSDPTRTTGFPTAAVDQTNVTATGADQPAMIYGRIAAGQTTVEAGYHSDTVLMTLIY